MEITMWSWGALTLALAIGLAGFVVGRKLPEERRRFLQQKFSVVALIPVILLFMFSRPFVGPWTRTWSVRDTPSSANSPDEMSRRSLEQQNDIQGLRNEVDKLRTELAEINDYYGYLTSSMLLTALIFCIMFPLKRRRGDGDAAENFPLGLNQDDKK